MLVGNLLHHDSQLLNTFYYYYIINTFHTLSNFLHSTEPLQHCQRGLFKFAKFTL